MDNVLVTLERAIALNQKVELKGMGPKLGVDRLTLLWRKLKEGGYTRTANVEVSRNVFNETWERDTHQERRRGT